MLPAPPARRPRPEKEGSVSTAWPVLSPRFQHQQRAEQEDAQRQRQVVDPAFPDHIHCTPDMVLNVLDELRGEADDKLILAHLGGCFMPGEVLKKLIGAPVYMDTAAVLSHDPEKSREIITRHGADRILFASDSPWFSQREYIEIIRSYGFSKEDEDKIFYKNACKILKIKTGSASC